MSAYCTWPAQVEGAVRTKEVLIRASASGHDVRVLVHDDDTLTVTVNGGSPTNIPAYEYDWSQGYGTPRTLLTVHRDSVVYKRAIVYEWRVELSFGGHVRTWPTYTMERNRR